jgi:uncharacterized protein YecT (DUF1311 family)
VAWFAFAAALLMPALSTDGPADPTATALSRCLARADHASTAGQTECEGQAAAAYDRRMNAAYAALLRALPAEAGAQLRQSQRAWLLFRDAEGRARSALFATRQGTMYVPMEASAATDIVRDRALQLESALRVMRIDA